MNSDNIMAQEVSTSGNNYFGHVSKDSRPKGERSGDGFIVFVHTRTNESDKIAFLYA